MYILSSFEFEITKLLSIRRKHLLCFRQSFEAKLSLYCKEFLQSPIVCICRNVTNFDVHTLMDLGPVESYVVGAEVSLAAL